VSFGGDLFRVTKYSINKGIMVPKRLAILGSTGSIGLNALRIVDEAPELFTVVSLTAAHSVQLLAKQGIYYQPEILAVLNAEIADKLKMLLPVRLKNKVVYGLHGYLKAAVECGADLVLSAMVGAAGLIPTFGAVAVGITVALANKDVLVAAGELIMAEAKKNGVSIIPVDSEHSAIFQALAGNNQTYVQRLFLTASGGPLRTVPIADFNMVTRDQVLNHPNWNMGSKNTVDSATMMNKGLEVIEAHWLFDQPLDKVQVLIHPQSVVHSLVEYIDGSVMAQLGVLDMRLPIAFALNYPERRNWNLPFLDLTQIGTLFFEHPDLVRFPALHLAYQACRAGGTTSAVLGGANEVAVENFLFGRLDFLGITACVAAVLDLYPGYSAESVMAVLEADSWARIQAQFWIDARR